MAIVCPHCQNHLKIKGARPGRYTPRCVKCGKQFALTVPDDPQQELMAVLLPVKVWPVIPADRPAPPTPPAAASSDQTAAFIDPEHPHSAALSQAIPLPQSALEVTTPETPMAAAGTPPTAARARQKPADAPETLGGYQILKQLGRGGMGTVYLARQVSLDRKVALKVMNPQWAEDATFVARFTREAYAAAQLVHHNVIQIYDIGSDRGFQYSSMEFVEGESLSELSKREGKLDVEVAIGYVLQAARGLKFAHDHGMIHRDIKPDNLMLNTQGIVKVADLGLVKTPGLEELPAGETLARARDWLPSLAEVAGREVTLANVAMGTPAYMAPEQARDAARVDARADIYSLGCTLYVLLTGRPPFSGTTALEVMSKHAHDPLVPPDQIVKRVPRAVSEILLKMMAKKPEERFANMSEVIKALEEFLGVQASGPFSPSEEHANLLEECAQRFNLAPAARLRERIFLGFFGSCAALLVFCLLFRWWGLALGFLSLAFLTPLCYFLVSGLKKQTFLFQKVRELILGTSWTDRLMAVVAVLLFLGLLWLLGLFGLWLGFTIMAVTLAMVCHFGLDRQVAAQRQGALAEIEQMLRSMRLRGLEEEALRQFVCKYSGERWEEFYEALFGYEAKLAARTRWTLGERGMAREKFASWRDPLVHWIDARQRALREARAKKHLQEIEAKSLKAQGLAEAEARARAEQLADAMLNTAASLKEQQALRSAVLAMETVTPEQAALPIVTDLLGLPQPQPPSPARMRQRVTIRFFENAFDLVLGPRIRFLLGAVLLAGCVGWLYQNGMIPGQEIKDMATEALDKQELPDATAVSIDLYKETQPLNLPLVPFALTEWVSNFNAGLAGLILIVSALWRGVPIALFMWPAALVAFAGHRLGIPDLGSFAAQHLSLIGGAALALLGLVVSLLR